MSLKEIVTTSYIMVSVLYSFCFSNSLITFISDLFVYGHPEIDTLALQYELIWF